MDDPRYCERCDFLMRINYWFTSPIFDEVLRFMNISLYVPTGYIPGNGKVVLKYISDFRNPEIVNLNTSRPKSNYFDPTINKLFLIYVRK